MDGPDLSQVPQMQRYSALEAMVDTPMGNVVLKSLRKKSADVSFLCGTVCDAAVQEGSRRFMTKTLATITREARFHSRLASCLPKVEQIKFPVQIKKKLQMKAFSFSVALCSLLFDNAGQLDWVIMKSIDILMSGFIRPSSWFKWLEKRQNLLKHMVYGKSSESDRQVPLGCKFSSI